MESHKRTVAQQKGSIAHLKQELQAIKVGAQPSSSPPPPGGTGPALLAVLMMVMMG